MNNGHTNPTTTLRKSFVTGKCGTRRSTSDPAFDKKVADDLPRAATRPSARR